MSTWKVELTFVEGSSSKFWRARVDGATLYVNYGRIGSDGQTQVKALSDAGAALRELEKLEREKRKKGYDDASGDPSAASDSDEGDEDEDDDDAPKRKKAAAKPAAAAPTKPAASAPASAPPASPPAASAQAANTPAASPQAASPPAGPARADFTLATDGRRIEASLTRDGDVIRTTVTERYATPEDAARAFERLSAQLATDGYTASR